LDNPGQKLYFSPNCGLLFPSRFGLLNPLRTVFLNSYERIRIARPDGELSALVSKNEKTRSIVILHGMRDHAHSMIGLAESLQPDYRIILPDLRGHGESSTGGGYAMVQFVADLRAVIVDCKIENPIIVGHSLGGHIASRYAASYPDEVEALVLLDGMGPPSMVDIATPSEVREHWLWSLKEVVNQFDWLKPMSDEAEALKRLTRNNPRLDVEMAKRLITQGVRPHPDGGIRWKWDPTVNMVWQTFSHEESEMLMQFISCPTLIVTGDDGLAYWTNGRFDREISADWYESELKRRQQLFVNARSEVINDAGHMLHYDQPAELSRVLVRFVKSLP
jgi:pimeloyl-ACP methyl ester carboxylesterase